MRIAVLLALLACGPRATPDPIGPITSAPPAAPRPAEPPRDPDRLALWPKVKRATLPNGLTYYVLKHGEPKQRAMLWLAVNAGSVQEDDDQRGLAHFIEHMAFNGTRRFPKHELIEYIEKIGMRFGADLNAYTSFDETVYQLEVPTDDKAFLEKGLDILRDWAGDVVFDPAEVDKERGVVLEEWRLGRGAGRRLFDRNVKVLYRGTRYADRMPIGLPETLTSAPRDALVRYYKDWYRPERMAVIAVGDFDDPAAVEREIVARFGDLKAQGPSRVRPPGGVPKADGTRVSIETDREAGTPTVRVLNLMAHRPEATKRDFRRGIAEQLYANILGERLFALGRRKEAAFVSAGVDVDDETRDIEAFTRFASVRAGKVEDALRTLFVEVLRVEKHGFSQSELERARRNMIRSYEDNALTEATSDSRGFTREITRNFFEGELMIGAAAERDLTLELLPTIALDELNALAKGYGGADNRVILISGPEPSKQGGVPLPTQERVLAIIDEVEKQPIDPWQDKGAATALLAQPPTPGTIVKESTIAPLGVTEWTLSNGVRVIVKPTDFEIDAVAISSTSPGGLAVANAGLYKDARFANEIVARGGLGDLDVESLRQVLTGKRASVSASIGEVTEGIDASGSVRDLETIFQLIYLRVTAPRKDDEAIGLWRSNSADQITNSLRSPDVQFGRQSSRALYGGNPRRLPPEPADYARVNADRAIAFYKDRFGDVSDFTFVIVGAVDLAKLRPLVETYLASLPAKGRKEKERDPAVRKVGGVVKKSWALGLEPKARVSMLFHGDEVWSRDRDRDMYVLGRILSTRLREILREDLGGVYGVGASGFLARSPHQERQFSVSFGCAPENVDRLVKATFDEIARLAKEGTTDDYLEKVKKSFVRERETAMRTNRFWVNWLEQSARFGDDPTIVLDPQPMLARITSDHVKAAAKRFLDGRNYYQAVMLPGTP